MSFQTTRPYPTPTRGSQTTSSLGTSGAREHANWLPDAETSADADEYGDAGSGAAPFGVGSEGGRHLSGGATGRPLPGAGRARSVRPEGQDRARVQPRRGPARGRGRDSEPVSDQHDAPR